MRKFLNIFFSLLLLRLGYELGDDGMVAKSW